MFYIPVVWQAKYPFFCRSGRGAGFVDPVAFAGHVVENADMYSEGLYSQAVALLGDVKAEAENRAKGMKPEGNVQTLGG